MEWTKIEDELPKESGFYLGWNGEDVGKIWYWPKEKKFDDGCGQGNAYTHWMPLPPPPEVKV